MEKKKHGKLWAVLAVLILLIAAVFWAGKSLWQVFWSPRLPVSAVVQDEEGALTRDAVILFASQNEFQAGETGTISSAIST